MIVLLVKRGGFLDLKNYDAEESVKRKKRPAASKAVVAFLIVALVVFSAAAGFYVWLRITSGI